MLKVKKDSKFFVLLLVLLLSLSLTACNTAGTDDSTDPTAELSTYISQADWVEAKQYVDLSTGITMAYVEMGNPEGEPVVIVHGYTDSSRANSVMANYICEYADDYHLYIIDQRGSGNSDAPEMAVYGYMTFAEDLNQFFNEMGIDEAYVVGHSMGSRVVTMFAANYPDKVKKLALLGTSVTTPENMYSQESMDQYTSDAFLSEKSTEKWLDYWDYVTPDILDGKEYEEEVNEMISYIKEETADISVVAYIAPMRARAIEDFTLIYQDLTMETLLMHGETDSLDTKLTDLMPLLPNCVGLIVYEGSNHSIEWECPAEVAQDLIDFFQGMNSDSYLQEVPDAA
jgi:pimeloyl-ACP methyl ester carboxylesterase